MQIEGDWKQGQAIKEPVLVLMNLNQKFVNNRDFEPG